MRPIQRLIPFEEAERMLEANLAPTDRIENVPLKGAAGRALAHDVVAPMDVPPFDRSAMDGYAVRARDTTGAAPVSPRALKRVGVVHAGEAPRKPVGPDECFQIATGAPIPKGADAVIMVERTRLEGGRVLLEAAVTAGENVTPRGRDLRQGTVALGRGLPLTPARLGAMAALGLARAAVYGRPKVTLISTGSEIRPPGEPLGPGQIYDSNSTSLAALLEAHGVRLAPLGLVHDDSGALRHALDQAQGSDLILVTGSSSAGEKDLLVPLLQRHGEILFHGVDVRPGKPLLLARHGKEPLLGLAGNPASCLLMAYVLVVPALRRFQHLEPRWEPTVQATLAQDVRSPAGKRHFLPVRLRDGRAESTYKESDTITSLADADGYVEIAEAVERLAAGSTVTVRLFST